MFKVSSLYKANGGCVSNLTTFHGNVDTLLRSNYTLPTFHPSIPPMFARILPAWHPNLTNILANKMVFIFSFYSCTN